MNTITLITPWPPQPTGIADYAYDLAAEFQSSGLDVHIFTTELNPQYLEGITFHHIIDTNLTVIELECFDIILMQLGNHPNFHGYMLHILHAIKDKCIIELHDLMLHHLMQGDTGLSNGGDHYYSWLGVNYGSLTSTAFRNFFESHGDILEFPLAVNFPCSDVLMKNSRAIIVHSEFASSRLKTSGCDNVFIINLCQNLNADPNKNLSLKREFRIGVFGGVQRNRKLNWIIEAIYQSVLDKFNWRLDIVGDVDIDCERFKDLVVSLGMSQNVFFHGRLPLDEMNFLMSQCDIHIALRSPTMGETSAVVTRALQLGIPSIVSNIGWYSELPDFVLKVDDINMPHQLAAYISSLAEDSTILNTLKENTVAYSRNILNLGNTVDDILNIAFSKIKPF